MRYDPLGRLYQVAGSDTGTTRFVYDGDALVAEYDAFGTMLRRYVHGPAAGVDDPMVWFEGSGISHAERRYLYADERGSIVAVTDSTGAVLRINTYDEYGDPRTKSAVNAPMAVQDGGRFRYTGQAYIHEIGMYYYKARFYSPEIGRFLQTDPIGYDDQFNLYAYVGNDPVNLTDPTGLESPCITNGTPCTDPNVSPRDVAERMLTAIDVIAVGVDVILGGPTGESLPVLAGTRAARAALREGGDAAARAARTCCFVAGTLVDTERGLRPIEQIQIGDKVWARNEETGETALKEVVDLVRRQERVIWEVALAGPDEETERFETTDDHPWWIAGRGWTTTEDLKAGMAVVTRNGRGLLIESVIESDQRDATYNLTVADFETYFVGEQRVLVRNCFSRRTQGEIRDRNQQAGGGTEHCETCGQVVQRQQGPNQRGQKIAPDRSEVDHRDRKADGGSDDASNGQVLCHECHVEKTARENRRIR